MPLSVTLAAFRMLCVAVIALGLGMRIEAMRHGRDIAMLKKAADLRGSPAADFWRDEAFRGYEAGFNAP